MPVSMTSQSSQRVRRVRQCVVWMIVVVLSSPVRAVDVTIVLRDGAGVSSEQAVVALYGRTAVTTPSTATEYRIDQVDKQFVPRLLGIRVGDRVAFPNSDNIRHHVYSFSPARRFELPLYRGIPSAPVQFDTAGKVVLGCNIHDRMSAHIYVLDTPWFALTKGGRHTFTDLAPGNYEVAVFHPRQVEGADGARHAVSIAAQAAQTIDLGLELAPVPAVDDAVLSPLERKFKALRRGTP